MDRLVTSDPCPCCGAERPDRVERFGLTVQREPDAIYWKGIRYNLPRGHVRTLYLLVQRGRASLLALNIATVGEDAVSDVVRVRICNLRAWLRRLDQAPTIRTEAKWGYVLEQASDESAEHKAGASKWLERYDNSQVLQPK